MRSKKLLTYAALGVGAYLLYQHMKTAAVPSPAPAAAGPAAGFGRLGYFPSGADRPFARVYGGHPSAWWRTGRW